MIIGSQKAIHGVLNGIPTRRPHLSLGTPSGRDERAHANLEIPMAPDGMKTLALVINTNPPVSTTKNPCLPLGQDDIQNCPLVNDANPTGLWFRQ